MRKIMAIIFILAGFVLIVYPKTMEFYYNHQQKELIEDWQESFRNIEGKEENLENENDNKQKIEVSQIDETPQEVLELKKKEEWERKEKEKKEALKKQKEAYIKKYMEGILTIEKIKLNQPILRGATANHLNISVSSIENTGEIGEVGNYCIAGHRSHTYGRNFNRLDEVEAGDLIKVNDGKNVYTYIVYDKFLVKPEEVWVLNGNDKEKEITLITCHPMKNPTHRLIVKGKMME